MTEQSDADGRIDQELTATNEHDQPSAKATGSDQPSDVADGSEQASAKATGSELSDAESATDAVVSGTGAEFSEAGAGIDDEDTNGSSFGDKPEGIDRGGDTSSLVRVLTWGGIVVLALLALVAVLQLYWSVGAAIELWVTPQYEPIIQAVFNFVVLLVAVAGISVLLKS